MGLNSLDDVINTMLPTINVYKAVGAVTGRYNSMYYQNGNPLAGIAPSAGLSGIALSGTNPETTGQIYFPNAPAGENNYLTRWEATPNGTALGTYLLCDRLWHNSGITVTSTAVQTINSVPFGIARDLTGGSSGHGVMIGMEVISTLGAGTPTLTMNYTATDGTTATTTTNAIAASMTNPSFIPIPLASGHTGVISVNWWQQSASMVSGTISLVAYRVIGSIDCIRSNFPAVQDAIQLGCPIMYNNTFPFLLLKSSQTTGNGNIMMRLNYSQK